MDARLLDFDQNGSVYGSLPRNHTASNNEASEAIEIVHKTDAVRLTWNNVNVYANPDVSMISRIMGKKKQTGKYDCPILRNVSGIAEPGSVTAIMGSSGAGKSTLLNALTWRNRQNLLIEGQIKVNGRELEEQITNVSAYVQQDDLFIGALTVREHLVFSSRLRMGKSHSEKERICRVEEVMDQMGLRKCENSIIGTPGRTKTISGGERKRLSLASELLTNPPLLFCDEPTSGLDSYLAKVLCEYLRKVAKQGYTVLCTIHQPSSEVFELFDKVLLLASGRTIFLGTRDEASEYYSSYGLHCPINYNPADHYIMKISVIPGDEQNCRKNIEQLADYFQRSAYNRDLLKMIEENPVNIHQLQDTPISSSPYKATFLQQFYACLCRAMITCYRTPQLLRVRLSQSTIVALLIGLVYLRIPYGKPYTVEEISDVSGVLFLVAINLTYSYMFGVIDTFPAELPIFRREHFNGMYSTGVYFWSKSLAELPMYIFIPTVFSVIVYFMIGLYFGAAQFFIFLAVGLLVVNTSVSFGTMISCMSPTLPVALAIAPPMVLPLLLFGGFFLSTGSVPSYLYWLRYISWFMYANELFNINQWQNVGEIACQINPITNVTQPTCIPSNGIDVIVNYGFSVDHFQLNFLLLLGLAIGFRMIAFLILLFRMRDSTR